MAVMLCLGLIGSAFAYFSDVETSEGNTFTAGTLDLVLSDDDETDLNGVTATWLSPANWAPGDEVTATLTTRNLGSIGCYWYYFGISALTGDTAFADQIHVTKFLVTIDGWSYDMIAWMPTQGPWNGGAPLTLAEFAQWAGTATPYGVVLWGDNVIAPTSGNSVDVEMVLKFNPDADNEHQEKTCSFDVKIFGAQKGYPFSVTKIGEGSREYGYGKP